MKDATENRAGAAPPAGGAQGATRKARIVGELGEHDLLLPAAVNEALAANDRAKYLMTLLQAARDHADHPDAPASRLEQERLACGIADANLDTVVESSRCEDRGVYHIPLASSIHQALVGEVRGMLAPLLVPPGREGEAPAESGTAYNKRLQALLTQAPPPRR